MFFEHGNWTWRVKQISIINITKYLCGKHINNIEEHRHYTKFMWQNVQHTENNLNGAPV